MVITGDLYSKEVKRTNISDVLNGISSISVQFPEIMYNLQFYKLCSLITYTFMHLAHTFYLNIISHTVHYSLHFLYTVHF